MRKYLWIFSRSFNYAENPSLTDVIVKCIDLINNCHRVEVIITQYDIYITTPNTEIKLWNENKFYGWLSNGKINGIEFREQRPSASVMYDFKECLKRRGFNIYIADEREKMQKFDLSKIKC